MQKKISELPSANILTSSDVVLLINDNETKTATIASMVDKGLPENIEANVSIRSRSKIQLDSVLPIGELVYENDTGCLKIGNGNFSGGIYPNPSVFTKIRTETEEKTTTNTEADSILSFNFPDTLPGIFNIKCLAEFGAGSSAPPAAYLYYSGGAITGSIQKIYKMGLVQDGFNDIGSGYLGVLDEKKCFVMPGEPTINANFDNKFTWRTNDSNAIIYVFESEFQVSDINGTISLNWGSAIGGTKSTIISGLLTINKIG
jgi:hypothetical protein